MCGCGVGGWGWGGGGERELTLVFFSYVCSVCACLDLSVSSSSWGLGRAAVYDCGTPWTFLLPFSLTCSCSISRTNVYCFVRLSVKIKPCRTPVKNREVIDKAVNEKRDADVIKRSRSPWSFSVVIVDKKDGSKRFC